MLCKDSKLDKGLGILYASNMAYKDKNDPRLKEARRRYYEKNKEAHIEKVRAREREMLQYVWTQKAVPCMDCDTEYNHWVMQLDHRPDEVKVGNINDLIKKGSWKNLLAEIKKCDVVCANCHIIRTATRANWNGQDKFTYQVTF